MMVPKRRRWAPMLDNEALSLEAQAVLAQPLRTRISTLLLGHVTSLAASAMAMMRLGGEWPTVFLVASALVVVARIAAFRRGRRWAPLDISAGALRWLREYQAVGLVWAAVTSALCCFCVAGDDKFGNLLGLLVALGICASLASRNAGTPRYAVSQLAIFLVPLAITEATFGDWFLVVSLLICIYLAALSSTVRQHYTDMRLLIGAELRSRTAHATLAVREAELRSIFENAAAGIVEWNIAGRRMVRVNAVFCRMTGRSEPELLDGMNLPDMTHPEDKAAETVRWKRPCAVGQTLHYEKRYLRPDGTNVWVQVSSWVTAVDAQGLPARAVCLAQDCTQQKAAEAALRASDEMLRLAMEAGGVGTFQRDYRTRTVQIGMQGRIMHGLPLGHEPIPFAVWGARLLPEDLTRLTSAIDAAHAEQRESSSYDYRFVHPTHGLRHMETRARTQYNAAGEPVSSIGVVIDVTGRRLAEERIAHLAHHDPLTSLPNRSLFGIRLDEALARARRGHHFALLCLDLDRFKDVNDTLGHPIGDALLLAVTERLNAAVRPTDTVARLGGDEFALIQSSLERPSDAVALAKRLVAALGAPFDIEGYHVVVGASIGIAMTPDGGMEAESLMRHADVALYAAKAEGRGRFRTFEQHMNVDMQARRTLELDLRQALERHEFELFYQPVVRVSTGEVTGFEALLRWHHPTRGLVPPDSFIPLAEETGLLVPIGAWVLQDACAQAAGWPGDQRVAVNLSAVQFTGTSLVPVVRSALRASGLDPRRLELEITETAMLQDTEATLATLHELKALGVTVAMDDFGTGYSSLSYLQRFSFDKVKIDRSFVSHLGIKRKTTAIVSAVIEMCNGLDMLTTAEGVETEGQLATLAEVGCTEAQGYYFSPPRPACEIAGMIERIEQVLQPQPAG